MNHNKSRFARVIAISLLALPAILNAQQPCGGTSMMGGSGGCGSSGMSMGAPIGMPMMRGFPGGFSMMRGPMMGSPMMGAAPTCGAMSAPMMGTATGCGSMGTLIQAPVTCAPATATATNCCTTPTQPQPAPQGPARAVPGPTPFSQNGGNDPGGFSPRLTHQYQAKARAMYGHTVDVAVPRYTPSDAALVFGPKLAIMRRTDFNEWGAIHHSSVDLSKGDDQRPVRGTLSLTTDNGEDLPQGYVGIVTERPIGVRPIDAEKGMAALGIDSANASALLATLNREYGVVIAQRDPIQSNPAKILSVSRETQFTEPATSRSWKNQVKNRASVPQD